MPEITEYAQGTPSWAELSTTSETAALEFYGALFGWADDPQPAGPDMIYHMQKSNGLEAAAIFQQSEDERNQGIPPHWTTYFTVENVDQIAEKAAQTGGKVVFGPFDVFEAGRMAVLQDRQGAVFAAWQPKSHIGSRVKYEPNSVNWSELLTTDPEDAGAFYSGLFGVETGKMPGPVDYTLLKVQGTDVAGFMQITSEMGPIPPNWMVYFGVVNTDESVAKAESLGGTVLYPATDIPDIGRFAVLQDPQGAAFSVIALA